MRPLRLSATNFLQYPGLDIDLSPFDQLAISGRNGSGKSSILDAITWALYGKCERGSADELIRRGSEDMRVALVFELGGRTYTVIRDRTLGKTSALGFFIDQERLTRRTIGDTDNLIAKTLNLPYDTFLASCMVTQGRADEFTRLPAGKRKQVLYDVLGLQQYAEMEADAAERRRTVRTEAAVVKADLERVSQAVLALPAARQSLAEGRVAAQAAVDASERAKAAEEAARGVLEAAEKRRRESQTLMVEAESAKRARAEATERAKRLLASASECRRTIESASVLAKTAAAYDTLMLELDVLDGKAEAAAALAAELEQIRRDDALALEAATTKRIATARALVEGREAAQHLADSSICGTCPFVETELAKAASVPRLEAEHEQLTFEISIARQRVDHPPEPAEKYDAAHHREVRAEVKRLQPAVEALRSMREVEQRRDDFEAEARLAQVTAKSAADRQASFERKVAALGDTETVWSEADTNARATRAAYVAAVEASTQASAEGLRLSAEVDALERQEETRLALVEQAESVLRNLAVWEYITPALGKDGIPALIIENAVPAIEEVANEILGQLPEAMRLHLALRRTLKSRDAMADTLEVEIEGSRTGNRYELLSGGEKDRVNIALRIGIARVAATRYGAQMRFFAVDEAFASQDGEGLTGMLSVLAAARAYFDLVVVISHLSSVRDSFPARLMVEKTTGGSRVAVSS